MALTHTPAGELGSVAPPFRLRGVDDQTWSLDSFWNARALLVVFMCNHCPYVQAVSSRINALAQSFGKRGLALVGINPNDSERYPDDDFASMKRVAREQGYVFPYLVDDTQLVARAYGAVCTPDFFLYSKQEDAWRLHYRGRLDDSWKDESRVRSQDLAEAIERVLARRDPTPVSEQHASMGCSIKWR